MKQRTSLLGLGLLAIILAIAPASAATESGTAGGTVGGGEDSAGVTMDVGIGWNQSGLSCYVAPGSNVLNVWHDDPPPGAPERGGPPHPLPADCDIEFQVFLPKGKTLSEFNFLLDVHLEDALDNDDWSCSLVRWKTFQSGQQPQEGTVITKGFKERLVPIGANAPPPTPIPALGEWGMIFLGIGVVLTAVLLIRRRIAAQQNEA